MAGLSAPVMNQSTLYMAPSIDSTNFALGMVQILGFSGNSTDRPHASTVEILCVVGPIADSGKLEPVKAQHVEPVRVRLVYQALSGRFLLPLWAMGPLKRPVIEQEFWRLLAELHHSRAVRIRVAGGGAGGDAPDAQASALGLPCGQPQPPKRLSPSWDTTDHGRVQREVSKTKAVLYLPAERGGGQQRRLSRRRNLPL